MLRGKNIDMFGAGGNVKFSGLSIVNEVVVWWLQSQCTEACLSMFEHVVAITMH